MNTLSLPTKEMEKEQPKDENNLSTTNETVERDPFYGYAEKTAKFSAELALVLQEPELGAVRIGEKLLANSGTTIEMPPFQNR